MTVKFIQQIPARYSVVKTENLETQPTGTLLSEAPYIDSGTYDESQLSTIFSILPSSTGKSHAVTYYVAVTVDETTTYTSWVITKVQNSDNKYVQYRLMSDEFTTDIAQWQGVDNEIISGSKNLIEGNAVFKELYNTNFSELELSNNRGGYVRQSTGEIYSPESDNWRLYYFPCSRGDRFKVKYTSWSATVVAAYSVFNDNTIEDSSIASIKGPLGESDIEYDVVIADSNAKWFVVQEKLNTTTQTFQFGCSVKKAINTNKIIQQMFNSKDWIANGNVVYDSNEIPVSCDIKWADGTLGTLVYSNFNDNVFEYTTLTATYNTQTIVYTLTFDENGYITNETINIQ